MKPKCRDCTCWERFKDDGARDGRCFRRSPFVVAGMLKEEGCSRDVLGQGVWPKTWEDDGCWDYIPIDDDWASVEY